VIGCKGVSIGNNSVIGAGSVVVKDIPADTIAAGNPARVVRHLDPQKPIKTRSQWFANAGQLAEEIDSLDRNMLMGNTLTGWARSALFPARGD